eukprot:TRINITY_DN4437_c0_g1_i1.p1 TRINITY_DN4437_c0_g1~~TRINITY_DN4437_c0_g1_i1.p1  ORF type:complete len:312 (-),score=9.31 TRINITY_DN4437_c0_g1_i1:57-992(-)
MIISIIISCTIFFTVPGISGLWLGIWLSGLYVHATTANTLMAAINALSGLIGGILMLGLSFCYDDSYWGITYAILLVSAIILSWLDYNSILKTVALLHMILVADWITPRTIITEAAKVEATLNATSPWYNVTLSDEEDGMVRMFFWVPHGNVWKPFSDMLIPLALACGTLFIMAFFPFPRLAREELKKEFVIVAGLQAKIISMHWHRIQNPKMESLYSWKRMETDVWDLLYSQIVRSNARVFNQIQREALWQDMSPYHSLLSNLLFNLRTLRIFSLWVNSFPRAAGYILLLLYQESLSIFLRISWRKLTNL